MSLYFEAAAILSNTEAKGGSLKNRIFGKKDLKSPPGAVYAVIAEATKWSSVLKEVVERSEILKHEKKLTPTLALLLTHDLLLSKRGVAAPKQHILYLAITRHKNRLNAEFTKCRIRRGFASVEAFRTHINTAIPADDEADGKGDGKKSAFHPRWVRVNAIKTTLDKALSTTFAGYARVESLTDLATTPKGIYVDEHIPDLVAIHPSADFSRHAAYRAGQIIFQDKASCFPAYLLDPQPTDGHVIDACAAPGNKTTHLAAIMSPHTSPAPDAKVTACERDPGRAQILQKMTKLAGADGIVTVKASQDFTRIKPHSAEYVHVGALLLDPSCSGSGIIGRDDTAVLHLPLAASEMPVILTGKKRKRLRQPAAAVTALDSAASTPEDTENATNELSEETPEQETDAEKLKTRLANLAGFQLKIILHAFSFPSATRITYSTCSIHAEENEQVVLRALASGVAKQQGWKIMKREDQVDGMKRWARRGDPAALEGMEGLLKETKLDAKTLNEACIRCEQGTDEGTMGFFVAGFVRSAEDGGDGNGKEEETDDAEDEVDDDDDEWAGLSD
ncbi:hypothetical protein AAFC00_000200 [Neodothiora populina]|uniref:SAM-dependent MTase RsmB/NOP-type domain-containing protein n=1 Tax=Neodothiora populina TaxID=2781224 RepID=A0ABR3P293_9PEZI